MLYRPSKIGPPMGSIIGRTRKDGTTAYLAQILLKSKGKIVHRECQTFDRKQAAKAWLARRETELSEAGGFDRSKDVKLADVIDRYVRESEREIGRTKAQVLAKIKEFEIADMPCSEIRGQHLTEFARSLNVQPQTRANYLSHLSAIFRIARPLWGHPLDLQQIQDAVVAMRKLGTIAKSNARDRRPTLEELDRLMNHFENIRAHRPSSVPMTKIIAFAIFSTRRQEEITRITWADYDKAAHRVWVRDMKNPGDKKGNHVLCELTPEAVRIIESMPRTAAEIFPYTTDAIGAAFTRACPHLEIADLRFHDLRHEGISRLFEMGRTIPQVAAVSGHRSWSSLQRYTHLRERGDKYLSWEWLPTITSAPPLTLAPAKPPIA
jgi:integrase